MTPRTPLLTLSLAIGSCSPWQALPEDTLCLSVAEQVSAVTHRCTGDGEAANARYAAWLEQVSCAGLGPADTGFADPFECVAAIGDMSCEQVEAKGDDFAAWIAISAVCQQFLSVEAPSDSG